MTKEAVFTMKIEPDLREEFMAEAQALDRPASQVVRDLMREFGFCRISGVRTNEVAFSMLRSNGQAIELICCGHG